MWHAPLQRRKGWEAALEESCVYIVLALPVSGVKRLWLSILPLLKHECQLTGSVRDPNCLFDCDVELAAPAAPATAIAEHCLCVFKA